MKATLNLFLDMAPYLMIGLFFVGLLNIFFNKDLIARHIGDNNFLSILKAALFGIPLPLCSCGVVPSSVYMAKNGASKSSVVSFLIATPQTGIDSIIATYGMMGWIFAIFRPFAALMMGIIGGTVIRFSVPDGGKSAISFKNYKISENNCNDDSCNDDKTDEKNENKIIRMFRYSFIEFLDDISMQFVIGLLLSGIIAYIIPDKFLENSSINSGLAGMLIMILVGVPMYVCATASIPIAVTLMLKGFSPGVAFVFLAVGPATNAASFTIIMNVLGKKTAIIYVAMISITAMLFGLLLDKLFAISGTDPIAMIKQMNEHDMLFSNNLKWIIGTIFFILIIMSFYRKFLKDKFKTKEEIMDSTTIKIDGMTCQHCVMNVKKAIATVQGVSDVDVSLNDNAAYVKGEFDLALVEKAIEDVGYNVVNN
ncbi:MAG: SO_0444 family Cu/Zn efflux transporter [Chlorobi bacterium]|nr:SO_0444 family Cu/Zn efflux transporter [Chlorobiota bacterium]